MTPTKPSYNADFKALPSGGHVLLRLLGCEVEMLVSYILHIRTQSDRTKRRGRQHRRARERTDVRV